MKIRHFVVSLTLGAIVLAFTQCVSSPSLKEGSPEEENLSFTVNGVSFNMVYVKGGSFTMGTTPEEGKEVKEDETPSHSVTVSDYYIGETEVTQELWEAVMGKDENPSEYKGVNLPVEMVSWEDCDYFITKLNKLTGRTFRLPTEAEWEYAARGGSKSKGFYFSGSNTLSDVAWYDDIDNGTHPVKGKAPNELGIYDMSGNVAEWCYDYYAPYSSESQSDPKGPTTGDNNVTRGGGFSADTDYCRVSGRGFSPGYVFPSLGFRLAL